MCMERIVKIATAVVAIAALSFPAVAQEANVWVVGIGGMSCAVWISDPRAEAEGNAWILGYWSGVNMANDSSVGNSTDGLGIIERVKAECRANPALRVLSATSKVRAACREVGR